MQPTHYKFEDSFLNQPKDLILIRTRVIENNINQKYYISIDEERQSSNSKVGSNNRSVR